MRAVTVSQFGELPRVSEVATPVAGPGQILIKLAAASFNPMDVRLASGEWQPAPAIFPMVVGVDGAGVVEAVGEGTTRFSIGDNVFGQLFIPPIGAFGTYAEYVAVTADAPLALVPSGIDLIDSAASPTAGTTGLSLIEMVEPLEDRVVFINGAGGGVGSFSTQFAISAGATVVANINAAAEERMRAYGVTHSIVRSREPVADAIRGFYPDGVDVLVDLVSDAKEFAAMTTLVRAGGTAITSKYVADIETLKLSSIVGVNYALPQSTDLMQRFADALGQGVVVAPPITRISLDDAPALFGVQGQSTPDGKTVIVM
jgi:NADPH:quinone reductase-like Zn-dependent oxidoreductase